MSEDGHSEDAEIWARYLKAGLAKQLLDFSALYSLSQSIHNKPELNELHSSLISEFFDTVLFPQESEIEAIFGLMVAGTIVANLRTWTKDDSDADFLSRLLKFSVPKFEVNINKGWSGWVDALTWTLQEWKQNYNIVSSLNSAVKKLLSGKERQNLRDVHFTTLIDLDAVDTLMRRTPSEYVTLNLLRVWEHSFCPSSTDQIKDGSPYVLLPSCNNEGWDDLVSITHKYVKSSLTSAPGTILFRTIQDKFSILILNFVKMHSAAFVESSVGACVRALASLVQGRNLKEFLQSANFRGAVDELVTYLKYTLENMHAFSPLLAKFICALCDSIREAKGANEYWQELSGLLVLRVLAPAISNPLVYGIVDFCGPAAMNVLKETTKLLHHIWLGKPVDLGDLSDVPWVNGMIPQWQTELQTALGNMMAARKAEPKPFILPKALVIFDLTELTKAFTASGMQLSRFPESPSITKLRGGPKGSLKPPLPSKKRETSSEEIEEKIATDDQEISLFDQGKGGQPLLVNDTGQIMGIISKPKRTNLFIPTSPRTAEFFEDSTPSVAALQPVFGGLSDPQMTTKKQLVPIADEEMETVRSDHDGAFSPLVSAAWANSRGMQTTSCVLKQKAMQTEAAETCAKAVQALEYASTSESTQTDPESERFKLKARLRDEVYVKDREVETEFSWEQIAADKLHAEKELVQLKQYQNNEEQRTQTLNAYWGNQFQDLKRENTDLKDQIRALKEEIQRLQVPAYEEDAINQRASYLDLRETLKEQHFVTDERILQQIDPRTYIPGDFSHYKTPNLSFNFRYMSPVKNHRYESMSFKTEK